MKKLLIVFAVLLSFASSLNAQIVYRSGIQNYVNEGDLRNDKAISKQGDKIFLLNTKLFYVWDATSTLADNGNTVLKQANQSVGRFINYTKNFTDAEKAKLAALPANITTPTPDAILLNRANHTGVQSINTINGLQTALDANSALSNTAINNLANKVNVVAGKGLSTEDYTSAEKSKLAGIVAGATVNSTDAQLRDRTTHTGTQAISTISGLSTVIDTKVDKSGTKQLSDENYTLIEKNKLISIATGATANSSDATLLNRANHTGTQEITTVNGLSTALDTKVDKNGTKQLSDENYTTVEKNKLSGISSGATANSSDATLLSRANHTGTQTISTIANLQTSLDLLAPKDNPLFTNKVGIGTVSPVATLHVVQPSASTNGGNSPNSLTVLGGNGGNNANNSGAANGGKGGGANIAGGVGGNITGTPSTGMGGQGGDISFDAGAGGSGTGSTGFGGNGGNATLAGGTGGIGNSFAGNGGYVTLQGGSAASFGNSSGGNIYLVGGYKTGAGVDGDIMLGVSPSLQVRGNVGIGLSTAPTSKLHVNGKLTITDGTQGAGKVLTSDANGLASWTVASGGSGDSDTLRAKVVAINNDVITSTSPLIVKNTRPNAAPQTVFDYASTTYSNAGITGSNVTFSQQDGERFIRLNGNATNSTYINFPFNFEQGKYYKITYKLWNFNSTGEGQQSGYELELEVYNMLISDLVYFDETALNNTFLQPFTKTFSGYQQTSSSALEITTTGFGVGLSAYLSFKIEEVTINNKSTVEIKNSLGNINYTLNSSNEPSNISIGKNSNDNNIAGIKNILLGNNTLEKCFECNDNIVIGDSSLQSSTNSVNTISIGSNSLKSTTSSNNIVTIGNGSLSKSINSYNLISIGNYNMDLSQGANNNIAIGSGVLRNTSSIHNIGIGSLTLGGNGDQSTTITGVQNIGIGSSALGRIVSANWNVGIGYNTLSNLTSGFGNIGIGDHSLREVTTTNNNIGIGLYAGTFTTGSSASVGTSKSVFLGAETRTIANAENQVVIGYNAQSLGQNTVSIGNVQTTRSRINGTLETSIMTTAQINAISSPTEGRLVWNTTLKLFVYHDGTSWKRMVDGSAM